MKYFKYFFILIFISFSFQKTIYSQTLKDSLLSINYNYYLGKPIDSLLAVIPQSYDRMFTASGSSMFVGAKIVVSYQSRDLWLYIWPSTNTYFIRPRQPGLTISQTWPLNNVRRELLGSIEVSNSISPWPLKEAY